MYINRRLILDLQFHRIYFISTHITHILFCENGSFLIYLAFCNKEILNLLVLNIQSIKFDLIVIYKLFLYFYINTF